MCNVISMYVFRLEHLLLDNQLVCSSLEKTVSLPHSIPSLHIILCVGLRFLRISSSSFYKSVGVFLAQFMFSQLYW